MSLWRDDPDEVARTIAMGESRRCDRRRLSRRGDIIDRITTGGDVMRTDCLVWSDSAVGTTPDENTA
ncbi:hypothetical protein HMPREF1162_1226 [ [[Propionibacterium] namnetense SK182B-JCVI]|uniref:Uncharacterized protein n=1 Tax=[Propionibacterium] namnetense SK182B-JCVI TaxID=1051006 RepID=F9NUM2_9ACTN|nr:hypothetical protein HMPREF1162_1226 [ [[Propionibacterium] namnetense SK182B-JCVI]